MKQIKYLLFILSFVLLYTSCEVDTNGRMPNDIMDANVGVIIVTATDPFVNVSDPAGYNVSVDVDLLFEGDFEKLDIVVVMNGDYTDQAVLGTITSVPQSFTFSTQDFADVLAGLSSPADIVAGDGFNLFTNITLSDGTYLPGYTAEGVSTNAPSVRNIMGVLKEGTGNLVIAVPCALNIDDFLGVMDATEFWVPDLYEYQVEVILDPDYTGDNIGLIIVGMWDGTWDLSIEVLADYSIVANPDPQVMADMVWGVYSTPTWSQVTGGINTCTGLMSVDINSMCVTIGCFGGMPIEYRLKKAVKKTSSTGEIVIPEKLFRMVN